MIVPLLLIVVYAFTDDAGRMTLENFRKFLAHPEAVNTFIYSIGIAILTTIGCIVLGYPAAWILSRSNSSYSRTLILLFILPMWVNILIRTLATVALFDFASLPLGEGALIFGMIYNFIPFMIYPIYNTLQKMDPSYVEAAQDLGANSFQVFWKVVFPLSMPGVVRRHHDGVHADHLYLCHCRIADHEQHQVVSYDYSRRISTIVCGTMEQPFP